MDKNILKNIIREFDPQPDDEIIEIGPGTGLLTEFLIEKSRNLKVIEIDERAVEFLRNKFPDITVINNDFLKTDLHSVISGKKKVRFIGNIPYNITSQILIKFFDNSELISDAVIMVQEEVAKRIVSKGKGKDYGILSIFSNYYAETKILFNVSRNVFFPRPNVDSAVIRLKFKDKRELTPQEEVLFRNIIRTAFNQRRKMLRNSLSKLIDEEKQKIINLDFMKRAENLSVEDYIKLTKSLYEIIG